MNTDPAKNEYPPGFDDTVATLYALEFQHPGVVLVNPEDSGRSMIVQPWQDRLEPGEWMAFPGDTLTWIEWPLDNRPATVDNLR